jgi:ribosomal protein S18 acetylase RimI-like enzyme
MVHLRRAHESDALGIAEVHVRTWQQAYRDQLPAPFLKALSVEVRERYWANELRFLAPERRPWVAESEDGSLVGFACAGPTRDEAAPPLTGEVYAIYVLPDCWDRGLGRNLLKHCERDLIEHGYTSAVMWVLEDNARARAFYEAAGWQTDRGVKRDELGGRDVTEVRYRIALDRSRIAELV